MNLQNWGTGVWHFAHQKAAVGRDARLQWTIGALGSRLAKVNQHVALVGADADAQVNGVMFTEGKQHLTYHTLQHHEAPPCKSDLLYKGALQDKSRLVWRGMIKVDQRRAKDRRLSAQRQPDALRRRPAPIRSPAWRSKPTTSAARTARRPAAWTTNRSFTSAAAA